MNMFLRTLLVRLRARFRSHLGVHDVGRLPMRVLPNDLDVLRHVNNGVYFSLMDLGRLDLLVRSGVWATFQRLGYYPVVASETVTFRRSLQPWQRYELQTRIVGYDERAVYIEHRFVVDGEVYATAHVRGRFLKRTGGTVTMTELAAAAGVDTSAFPVPHWLAEWAAASALPASRESHASDWT
jgi:acyl-CoA thioesterase FadM